MGKRRRYWLLAALLAVIGGALAWWALSWYWSTYDALRGWYEIRGMIPRDAEMLAVRDGLNAALPQGLAAAAAILAAMVFAIIAATVKSPRRQPAHTAA